MHWWNVGLWAVVSQRGSRGLRQLASSVHSTQLPVSAALGSSEQAGVSVESWQSASASQPTQRPSERRQVLPDSHCESSLQAAQLRVVTSQRDAMSAVQCVSLVQATQLPSVGEPAVMSQARPAASPGHCASETHCTQRPALSKHAAVGAWQVVSSIHSAQRLVVVLHASVALPLVVVPAQCDASRHCTHWFVSVLQTGVELGLEESWHSALAWQRSVHVPLAASHTGVSGGQSVSPKQA
jgi:hypothetical protein